MDPLSQYLSTLGPWGVLAAVVIGFAVPKLVDVLKKKWPGTPTPDAPPAAQPPAYGPILSGFIEAIRSRLKVSNPDADPDHKIAAHLFGELNYGQWCKLPEAKHPSELPPAEAK